MRIELQFPPSLNNMFPSGNNGRRYLSKRGKTYRKNVHADVLEQHGLILRQLTGPLKASVELIPPDHKIRDIDNFNKAIFDSLKYAGCYTDDKLIKELHVYMREPEKGGKCIVILEEI